MLVPNWTLMDCTIAAGAPAVVPRWRALASRGLVPSGHNAPEVMAAAFAQWPKGKLALVEDAEDLRLALPLVRRRLPVPHFQNWSSPINFYGLPHVDRNVAEAALTVLLRKVAAPLFLKAIPMQGPLWEAVSAAATHLTVVRRWERAVLRPQGSFEHWFETNFDRKRRNTLRRLSSRLSEQGDLVSATLTEADDAGAWASQFLALEAAGWKGRRRTALMTDQRTAAAFQAACAALAASGNLRFWKLELDGMPLAMMFGYADGLEVWLGKIAYSEDYAKYSPGVQVLLHATSQLFAEGVVQADSCSGPEHPMVDHIWRDRLPVGDVLVAGPTVSRGAILAVMAADRARHSLKPVARAVLDRFRA
ncbi:MAG TPA: GNAT family N-acetyltransferase [Aestuariivirga sp.]|nr:GNAT family N-acetyltransferase [Aestuariivirga sp.]